MTQGTLPMSDGNTATDVSSLPSLWTIFGKRSLTEENNNAGKALFNILTGAFFIVPSFDNPTNDLSLMTHYSDSISSQQPTTNSLNYLHQNQNR
jgi:hypothetical protein